jgi:hypothetical protein
MREETELPSLRFFAVYKGSAYIDGGRMKRFALFLCIVFFSAMLVSGCAVMSGKAKGMAWVEISNATTEQIAATAKKVFINDGYEVAKQDPAAMVFLKPGSRMDDIKYGGLMNEEGVWVQAVLNVSEKGSGIHWLSCDVYMVKKMDDDFFRQETKVLKLFGGEYQRLLNQIKKEVAR